MNGTIDKWRYAVPLVNERTGERHVVLVELSDDERADAMRMGQGEGWPPLVNLFASNRALAGLPDECSVTLNEIMRVTVH
jgi:hypothetical protein